MNPNRDAPIFRIGLARHLRLLLLAALMFPGMAGAQSIGGSAFNLVELGIAIDATRQRAQRSPLFPDPDLRNAANGLARDMALSGRAWPFAGNGTLPILRIRSESGRKGFVGVLVGETWEGPRALLEQWLSDRDSRTLILDRRVNSLGLAVQDLPIGKHWVVVYLGE